MSASQSGQQTVSTAPWTGIQGQALGAIGGLQPLLGQPFQYYPGSTVAPSNPAINAGIRGTVANAQGPNLVNGARNTAGGLFAGPNPVANGSLGFGLQGAINGQAPTQGGQAARSSLMGMAGGSPMLQSFMGGGNNVTPQTIGQPSSVSAQSVNVGANNPYLDNLFKQGADQVQARLGSQFEGSGRLNSGAYQNAYASALQNEQGQVYGAEATRQADRQMQAQMANQQAGLAAQQSNQNAGLQVGLGNASNALSAGLANAGNRLQAYGLGQSGQLGASNSLLNDEGNQFQSRLGGLGLTGNIYGDAMGRAAGLDQASYLPYQQMMSAGGAQRGLEQQFTDADVQRFQSQQQLPWQQIQQYLGTIGYGTSPYNTQSQPLYKNPAMGALGGAATGAGAGASFGPYGALIGAGVGAIGGYYGSQG